MKPRFAVEAHLSDLFEEEEPEPRPDAAEATGGAPLGRAYGKTHEDLARANSGRHDRASSAGRPRRGVVRGRYRRRADFLVSATDPDASPMRRGAGGPHPGYHAHYAVDGGKARVILAALVTPPEVMEDQPMLDLLRRSRFRWRLKRLRRATGDTTYGTVGNVEAVEDAGARAYVPLPDFDKRTPFFGKRDFAYDAGGDVYVCPGDEDLRRYARVRKERIVKYGAAAGTCNACPEEGRCTSSSRGRVVSRGSDEGYLEKVRSYHGTEPYEKALRKRKVRVEPMLAEAKDRHGTRGFRLRGLERVNAEALLTAAGQKTSSGCSPTAAGVPEGRPERPPCDRREPHYAVPLARQEVPRGVGKARSATAWTLIRSDWYAGLPITRVFAIVGPSKRLPIMGEVMPWTRIPRCKGSGR